MSGLKSVRPAEIDHQVQVLSQAPQGGFVQSQVGISDVSLQHFHPVPERPGQSVAEAFVKGSKRGRFGDDLLEALQGAARALPSDQQVDPSDLRKILQQHGQPDLADESRPADQQDVLAGQGLTHREVLGIGPAPVEVHHRRGGAACLPGGSLDVRFQGAGGKPGQAVDEKALGTEPRRDRLGLQAVGDDGRMQAPGGQSVPKLQPVADQAPDTQMLGQGPEEMIQFPADQHHPVAGGAQLSNGRNPLGLEMVAQLVLEILFAQQVQAVPAGAPQRQVDQPGGQPGVPDAHDQVDGTHQAHAQQAVDSARKGLGVAGVVGGQPRGVDPEQPTVGTHEGKLSGLGNGVLHRVAVVPPGAAIQGWRSVPGGKTSFRGPADSRTRKVGPVATGNRKEYASPRGFSSSKGFQAGAGRPAGAGQGGLSGPSRP